MTDTEEVCPFCEATVTHDDAFCARCGEALTVYDDELDDEYEQYDEYEYEYTDSDVEIEADPQVGDDESMVYRPRARTERNEELKLLAGVLGIALVLGVLLGWALGWWGRGGSDDGVATDNVEVTDALAVDAVGQDTQLPVSEPVNLDRLNGLAIAFRDADGVHVEFADGRDRVDVAAASRAFEFEGGALAVAANDLFYIDGADVRRHDLRSGEDQRIATGDWVAAVPGSAGEIWIVDRREDDELGSTNVLTRSSRTGEVLADVLLPEDPRLDGATSLGVVVVDRATGSRTIVGPDAFEATVVPTQDQGGVTSPDGQWVVSAKSGVIVARSTDGNDGDEFDVILVPSTPTNVIDFVVFATG